MPHTVDWAVDLLRTATELDEVVVILRSSTRAGAGADGATVVLREDGCCFYADEDAVGPLWKGERFPLDQCISGWAMMNRETTVIPDVYADDRVPHQAYRPTFVHSMVMVPIPGPDEAGWAVGAIGAYWSAGHRATATEIQALQRLAGAASDALSRIRRGHTPDPGDGATTGPLIAA